MSENHYAYGPLARELPWEASIPVRIQLRWGATLTDVIIAKLDSGASRCCFHQEWAELLGIELTGPGIELGTPGQTLRGWQEEVELVVLDWKHGDRPVTLHATVNFVEGGRKGLALLGLIGFFDKFTLKIDDANQQLWWSRA